MTETSLGRVQGGGFFGSTSTSETEIPIDTVSAADIRPLVGDTIVNFNGSLCRIDDITDSHYIVAKYGSVKGAKGDKGDKGDQGVSINESGVYPNMTVGQATNADTLDGKHASEFATSAQGIKADNALATTSLLNKTYPVGAVYNSYSSTSPASLFGGTWTRIQGRFLLGVSSTYTVGSTGGSATHTLTIDEMPAHNHTNNYYNNEVSSPSGSNWVAPGKRDSNANVVNTTSSTGGGQPHSIMPPYLAVYMWRRTA